VEGTLLGHTVAVAPDLRLHEEFMAEGYQKFLEFDWSDERWQTYLDGLYPPPNHKQVLRFKKKWYKKNVDSDFDDTYEPEASNLKQLKHWWKHWM